MKHAKCFDSACEAELMGPDLYTTAVGHVDVQGPEDATPDDDAIVVGRTRPAASVEVAILPLSPAITVSILVFWVAPVLMLAFASCFSDGVAPPKPTVARAAAVLSADLASEASIPGSRKMKIEIAGTKIPGSVSSSRKRHSSPKPSPLPSVRSSWPTSYQATIEIIHLRNRKPTSLATGDSISSKQDGETHRDDWRVRAKSSGSVEIAGPARDLVRKQYEDKIDKYRKEFEDDPDNVFGAIKLADALRLYDVTYHDGGTKQPEGLKTYDFAIQRIVEKREKLIESGEETNYLSTTGTSVAGEVLLGYSQKSVDGLLCSLYTAKGKLLFMANLFEKAVESYSECLKIEPLYLDALSSRGSSQIILGHYEKAGRDLMVTIENDDQNLFNDAYTGLARILQAKEDVLSEGWVPLVNKLRDLIPRLEGMITGVSSEGRKALAGTLNRLHHVMFTYHDVKTKDISEAWEHLTQSYRHKMATLAPWQKGFEKQKVAQTMQIFQNGFWPPEAGSESVVPIFIVGFVRSGSTLLERVLDAHPSIVGTGEDSVFNGRLDKIRNEIVHASVLGDPTLLASTVEMQASNVVAEMKERWKVIEANTEKPPDAKAKEKPLEPRRFVDKMLNNYYNIGFIHMLFPKALILHVIREPMDTIFSAYKHEFPPGTLDYTSDFSSLAELYHSYRDLMDHWDKELPGRVTHVRYEDLVHDMEGMSRSIIAATGLEWHRDVLDFHKKKHAVNTLSTTQVRKGIYKHSLKSWQKYEEQLQPLVELIGDRVKADRETTLAGFKKPNAGKDKG